MPHSLSHAAYKILLIISGGIAAYKAIELTRLFIQNGMQVRCVLTQSACQFVTPLTLQSLTGEKVYTDLFSLTDEQEMGHISLSRWADMIVVCPATAHIMARTAYGIADDLATTILLAHPPQTPTLFAPAMNVAMWHNPATQRTLSLLKEDGYQIIDPEEGEMACHEYGMGRLAGIENIYAKTASILHAQKNIPHNTTPFGYTSPYTTPARVLVTAGPTHEAIDPVRFISNHSSGQQGYALAEAFQLLGQKVILVSGPVSILPPPGVEVIKVETALEMYEACINALPVDIAVMTAAVSDWRVHTIAKQKIKKTEGKTPPSLTFVPNPDILASLSQHSSHRPRLVIGFAAETENIAANALKKLATKQCDWIIANDVSSSTKNMGGSENQVTVFTKTSEEQWPRMTKKLLAQKIARAALEQYKKFL